MTATENPANGEYSIAAYANDPERIAEFSVWNDDVTSVIHAVERQRG